MSMMNRTDLNRTDLNLPAPIMSDAEFAEVSSPNKFLPRIQLMSSSSIAVTKRQIQGGNFGLTSGKDLVDLGQQFDCWPLNVRPKALDMREKRPVSYFDSKSEQFAAIKAASTVQNSRCMWGPEFLLWLPSEGKFATYFFGNPTHRRAAPDLKALLTAPDFPKPATISSVLIETEQYVWHGPEIVECSTPFDLPSKEEILEQDKNFRVLIPVVEPVEEDEDGPARAR
jgi:hypothetical protein